METAAGPRSRAISPSTLSSAKPHFSDLQKAMLDATPDCIKVVSADGRLLTMNHAGCIALNVPEDSDFGMPWLPLLPADVRDAGAEALGEAAAGRPARFPGRSLSPDGVRYWDNLLTPLVDDGAVLSVLCVSRDVTRKALLERELGEAVSRERLLSREMQHRVKNLFSVVGGLIAIAEREAAAEGDGVSATAILREKVAALARASDAAFAPGGETSSARPPVDLEPVVRSVLAPYGDRCVAAGGRALVCAHAVTTLTLFLHELATNSVKYGALGAGEGRVDVRWTVTPERLEVTWTESGGPRIEAAPRRRGFGSEMVDRIVQGSGAEIARTWRAEGLYAAFRLPIPPGEAL